MPEKNHPPVVSLKKIWVAFALMGALSVVIVILWNLAHSTSMLKSHQKIQESHSQTLANSSDMNWYQHFGLPPSQPMTTTAHSVSSAQATTLLSELKQNVAIDPDRIKAMSAPINSNQMVAESSSKTLTDTSTKASLKNPQSSYVIQAGTLIPGTGINSNLPGQIIGQVRT